MVKRRKRRAPARLLVLSPFSTSEFGLKRFETRPIAKNVLRLAILFLKSVLTLRGLPINYAFSFR
jgi:hypothetical protein